MRASALRATGGLVVAWPDAEVIQISCPKESRAMRNAANSTSLLFGVPDAVRALFGKLFASI
jgi:hypothetical protein